MVHLRPYGTGHLFESTHSSGKPQEYIAMKNRNSNISPVKLLDNRDKIATKIILLVMCPESGWVPGMPEKSILKYNWWKGSNLHIYAN